MNLGFSPYQGNTKVLKEYQDTDDIVKYMLQYHDIYSPDYDKASDQFWKGDAEKTGRFLFDFLKKNVKYDVEPNDDQTIKSPGALLAQKHGDCKHYASFICGIADSLKRKGYPIDCKYRFASYSMFRKDPHHVFAVIIDPITKQQYWTDPVLPNFNNRKSYSHSYDKKPGMALSSVSGIGRRNPQKKAQRKTKHAAKKQGRKAKRAERKANRPKGGFIKKIAGAPSRNAFLLLLKMNLFHKASNIYRKIKDDPEKQRALKEKWSKLGGNWSALKQAITQGVRVWNKHHKNAQLPGQLSGVQNSYGWDSVYKGVYLPGIGEIPFETERIGVVPVIAGAAALIAAAMPIIKALAPLFKKMGVKDTSAEEYAKAEEGNQVLEDAATNSNNNDATTDGTDTGLDTSLPVNEDATDESFVDDDLAASDETDLEGDYDMQAVEGIGLFKRKKAKGSKGKAPKKMVNKKANRALPGGTLPPVKVTAVPRANVKLPIAKKVKNITKAPFIQIQTAPIPKVNPKQKQLLHVPRLEATQQHQTTDTGGVANFFNEVKTWIVDHKNITIPVAIAGGALIVTKMLPAGKKRRR